MAGLLFSPARGLLWYSFPVILGLLGFPQFFKREKVLAWLMVADNCAASTRVFSVVGMVGRVWLGAALFAAHCAIPDDFCAAVCGESHFDKLSDQRSWQSVRSNSHWYRGAGGGIGASGWCGCGCQPVRAVAGCEFSRPVDAPLRYHHDPALVYDVGASPIFNHWQQLLAGEADNLAWLLPDAAPQLPEIATAIQSQQQPGDALIFVEPDLLYEVLDADLPPAYGLPYNVDPADELAHTLFEAAIDEAQRLWLVTWYAPGDSANWYEANLRQDWASISDEWVGDYRLILLARSPIAEK